MTGDRTLSITFDDCYAHTVRNVLPVLERLDVRATFYAIPDLVGGELDGMQLADWSLLERVVDRNHEIGSHTMTHASLPTTPTAQARRFTRSLRETGVDPAFLRRAVRFGTEYAWNAIAGNGADEEFDPAVELEASRRVLEERLGTTVESFAYPGGVVSPPAVELVAESSHSSARGSTPGINGPDADRYRLRSYSWGSFTDVADMDRLVASDARGWVIYNFHSVARDGRTDYAYTTDVTDLERHLEYVVDSTDATVEPVGDAVERRALPAREASHS